MFYIVINNSNAYITYFSYIQKRERGRAKKYKTQINRFIHCHMNYNKYKDDDDDNDGDDGDGDGGDGDGGDVEGDWI